MSSQRIKILSGMMLLCSSIGLQAQTFSSFPLTTILSNTTYTDDITVTGVGIINCTYGLKEVCIDITHTWVSDLDIYLTDPAGDSYLLTSDNGGGGNDYSVTCFDMDAAIPVTSGTAPFNGSYIPEGDIGDANNYQDADGVWTLSVTDDAGGDIGTWWSWSLVFDSDPDCIPSTSEDCYGGATVCSDETITGNALGDGNYNDLNASNDGCLSGENESSWYFFSAETDGTYAFMIETDVDYDFAVWGPMADIQCPPDAAPIRCSYSGTLGDTGLQAGAGDNSEDAGGDAVVNPITATAGDSFILVIDNYTADGSTFDLVWTLTGGATLDCTLLPIELVSFEGEIINRTNVLQWQSLTELNNDYYILERSTDGQNWEEITRIQGAGQSTELRDYSYSDVDFEETINYYRLSQVDFDGKRTHLKTISLDNRNGATGKLLVKVINLMGEEVAEDYTGVKVYVYDDGSFEKVVGRK
jgi:subtilisin-like proprotein convertase family protein